MLPTAMLPTAMLRRGPNRVNVNHAPQSRADQSQRAASTRETARQPSRREAPEIAAGVVLPSDIASGVTTPREIVRHSGQKKRPNDNSRRPDYTAVVNAHEVFTAAVFLCHLAKTLLLHRPLLRHGFAPCSLYFPPPDFPRAALTSDSTRQTRENPPIGGTLSIAGAITPV